MILGTNAYVFFHIDLVTSFCHYKNKNCKFSYNLRRVINENYLFQELSKVYLFMNQLHTDGRASNIEKVHPT